MVYTNTRAAMNTGMRATNQGMARSPRATRTSSREARFLPYAEVHRIVLLDDMSSDQRIAGEASIKNTEKKKGKKPPHQPANGCFSAKIYFHIPFKKPAISRYSGQKNLNLIPPLLQASLNIKFAVMDILDDPAIIYGPYGEPMFQVPREQTSPLSEKIFSFSEFMTPAVDHPKIQKSHIREDENSINYHGEVILRGIPKDIHNLALFCKVYVDNEALMAHFAAKSGGAINPSGMRITASPHKKYNIIQKNRVSQRMEKYFLQDGTEFFGFPYVSGQGRNITYAASRMGDASSVLSVKQVASDIIQDLRGVEEITNPSGLNFSSDHNNVKSLMPVLRDLSQEQQMFENEAKFSTLQHSLSEGGNVSGMFSVDILKLLRKDCPLPSLLDMTNDQQKRNFIIDVLTKSSITALSVFRNKVISQTSTSQLGKGVSFLTQEMDETPHLVVVKQEGRSSVRRIPLDNVSAVVGTQPTRLCGRLDEISAGSNFGVQHFAFKDYDVSLKGAGDFQYSCKLSLENGLIKVLRERKEEMISKRSLLVDLYEMSCKGSQAKGAGYFNNKTQQFSQEFYSKVYKTYSMGYNDLVKRAVRYYIDVFYILFDKRNKAIATKEPNKQDKMLLKTPVQLERILTNMSKTLEGLQSLIMVFDDLTKSLQLVSDPNSKEILSRQENSRIDGGSKSPRSIIDVEHNFKNLVHIKQQKNNKYDFIFNSPAKDNKTIFREMPIAGFEERWKQEQKKFFKDEVVNKRQRFAIPYGQGQVEGQSSFNSLLFLSPTRICGSKNAKNVVLDDYNNPSFATIAAALDSSEKSSAVLKKYKDGFFQLLSESLLLDEQAVQDDAVVTSIAMNEMFGSEKNLTIVEGAELVSSTDAGLDRDISNMSERDTKKGNLHALSVVDGVESFEDLMSYITLTSVLRSYRDDIRLYNLNNQNKIKAKELSTLKSLGHTMVNANITNKINEATKNARSTSLEEAAKQLFNSLPISVKSLIMNASGGNNLELLNDSDVTKLAGIKSLTQADILPYFVLNYKILTKVEVFTGYRTRSHRDGISGVNTLENMMGEPVFRQVTMNQLRQITQNSGKAICRVKRYFRGFLNIKENEHFDFPIANSLFVITGR